MENTNKQRIIHDINNLLLGNNKFTGLSDMTELIKDIKNEKKEDENNNNNYIKVRAFIGNKEKNTTQILFNDYDNLIDILINIKSKTKEDLEKALNDYQKLVKYVVFIDDTILLDDVFWKKIIEFFNTLNKKLNDEYFKNEDIKKVNSFELVPILLNTNEEIDNFINKNNEILYKNTEIVFLDKNLTKLSDDIKKCGEILSKIDKKIKVTLFSSLKAQGKLENNLLVTDEKRTLDAINRTRYLNDDIILPLLFIGKNNVNVNDPESINTIFSLIIDPMNENLKLVIHKSGLIEIKNNINETIGKINWHKNINKDWCKTKKAPYDEVPSLKFKDILIRGLYEYAKSNNNNKIIDFNNLYSQVGNYYWKDIGKISSANGKFKESLNKNTKGLFIGKFFDSENDGSTSKFKFNIGSIELSSDFEKEEIDLDDKSKNEFEKRIDMLEKFIIFKYGKEVWQKFLDTNS